MKKALFSLFTLAVTGCGLRNSKEGDISNYKPDNTSAKSLYSYTVKDIKGTDVNLADYKGKVVMVVNTASKCGLTPQYEGLEYLYDTYKDKGFVILGFPSNNFMGQEPGTNADIETFCKLTYDVSFPMFAKVAVKGSDIAPLYKFLTDKKENGSVDAEVTWNFQKFLIDKNGKVVTYFKPSTEPKDTLITKAIERLL